MLTPSKGLYTAESDRTHGASSTAQGIGLRRAVAGSACPFTVTAHDATGARRPKGGDMVLCRLTYPPEGDGAAETEPIEGQVCDNFDGTYSVTYRPTLAREGPLLRVSINGAPINGSPFRIDVEAGPTSAAHCTASGVGLTEGVTGEPCRLRIVSARRIGHPRPPTRAREQPPFGS